MGLVVEGEFSWIGLNIYVIFKEILLCHFKPNKESFANYVSLLVTLLGGKGEPIWDIRNKFFSSMENLWRGGRKGQKSRFLGWLNLRTTLNLIVTPNLSLGASRRELLGSNPFFINFINWLGFFEKKIPIWICFWKWQ
jgi:hypothetical protein